MKISENAFKWCMRLYPPFLLQRIWVQQISSNFKEIQVKINRCLATSNFGKATFGGTIVSAIDPFHALLIGQILRNKNYKVTVWLKCSSIKFLKPAKSDLFFTITISESEIVEIENELNTKGVFVKTYSTAICSKKNELIALAKNQVYIKKIN